MYWCERGEEVEMRDWYIVVVGNNGEEYLYDGPTDSIDSSGFVDEINSN